MMRIRCTRQFYLSESAIKIEENASGRREARENPQGKCRNLKTMEITVAMLEATASPASAVQLQ